LNAAALVTENPSEQTVSSEVAVKSTPDGAEIEIDGKFSGNTPSALKLPAGDHQIVISAKGFQTWQRMVTLNPGASITLSATLESESRTGTALRIIQIDDDAVLVEAGWPWQKLASWYRRRNLPRS
jgi:PEGA domain